MLKHGMSRTSIYLVWKGMRQRTGPGSKRERYQAVQCDQRWATFEGFVAHPPAGEYEPGKHLARFGDQGAYSPENCRWITAAENARESDERRMRRMPDGRFGLDVARSNGINPAAYRARIKYGWDVVEAATRPLRPFKVLP